MIASIDHAGLRSALGLPEHLAVLLVVALGRPGERVVLEEGRPEPLMLVRTRGLARPWNNHQVVAYGCSCDAVTGTMRLQVYDPNHVDQPVEITLDPTGGDGAPRLAQSTGEPLRGLFPLRYRPAPPPSI